MKMARFRISGPLLLTVLFVGSSMQSFAQGPQKVAVPKEVPPEEIVKVFNPASLKTFADKLEGKLKGNCIGYAFIVSYKQQQSISRAGGDARRAPDANPRKMTVDDKFEIASVSKMITATVVMKILADRKLDIDSPMHPFLHSTWNLGSNIKSITIRELLTHRSGIRGENKHDYDTLKKLMDEPGVNLADKKRKYSNSNYGLFRIIIPRMNGFNGNVLQPTGTNSMPEQNVPANYAQVYIKYVQENILKPAGLTGIVCKPIPKDPALCYQFPPNGKAGTDFGDWTLKCGSAGWNMSVKQLSTFFTTLLYTDKLVPRAVSEQMQRELMGFNEKTHMPGILTEYHHGGFHPGSKNPGELGCMLMNFTNGVRVALHHNSQLAGGVGGDDLAREAMKETLQ